MKPENWIDGLIWKDKSGKFCKIFYHPAYSITYPYRREALKDNGVIWYDRSTLGYELTDLTLEEARLIEML